jgi:hypothetical protein
MRGLRRNGIGGRDNSALVYLQRNGGLSLEDYNFSVEKGRAPNPAQQ